MTHLNSGGEASFEGSSGGTFAETFEGISEEIFVETSEGTFADLTDLFTAREDFTSFHNKAMIFYP